MVSNITSADKDKKVVTLFRVASISDNTNNFGLRGHILVAKNGLAFEVARSDHGGSPRLVKGQDVAIPVDVRFNDDGTERDRVIVWGAASFELPRALPDAPAAVLKEIFPEEGLTS